MATVLSIDGGGVRGIIPAVILEFLEGELEKLDGVGARLADYFDVIGGTSTGGLITALITTPNSENQNRPVRPAKDTIRFYQDKSAIVFSKMENPPYPNKYSNIPLHNLANENLGSTWLRQTLTNVVIPSYDINSGKPSIFYTSQAKADTSMDALLSDVCMGTSAAPTYFPPYVFSSFKLLDGGMVANDPTSLAVDEARKLTSASEFLVISLGTGTGAAAGASYGAQVASDLDWILDKNGDVSIVNVHSKASQYKLDETENQLRIQAYGLSESELELDNASKDNLDKLKRRAEKLLEEPRTNMPNESNKDALVRLAKSLSENRKQKLQLQ